MSLNPSDYENEYNYKCLIKIIKILLKKYIS